MFHQSLVWQLRCIFLALLLKSVYLFVTHPSVTITFENGHLQNEVLYHKIGKDDKETGLFPDCEKIFNVSGKRIVGLQILNMAFKWVDIQKMKTLPKLQSIEIERNVKLKKIANNSFIHNAMLLNIVIAGNNELEEIEDGAFNGIFQKEATIGILDLERNNLKTVPVFNQKHPGLKILKLSENPIENFGPSSFHNLKNIEKIYARNTACREISSNIFSQCNKLHMLDLANNIHLKFLSNDAFSGTSLRYLDLSGTKIDHIPHDGLDNLSDLKLEETPNLWEVSNDIVALPALRKVRVAKNQRWLCCAFQMKRSVMRVPSISKTLNATHLCPSVNPTTTISKKSEGIRRNTRSPNESPATSEMMSTTEDPFGGFGRRRKRRRRSFRSFFTDNSSSNPTQRSRLHVQFTDGFLPNTPHIDGKGVICNPNTSSILTEEELQPVECTPEPDELRPCDDIMGNVLLTSISWLFSIIAMLGNAMVFSVLVLSRRTVSVTKFLLINLSFADLCLALYLFTLVSASTHTHGNYYNYVKEWQFSGGCSLAGFLAIFSSQLSMFVLVVITIERYFAIVHAMHFHRRVTMFHASVGMAVAWTISLILAALPLVGVNSYTEVAICLPFRTDTKSDLAYLGMLLIANLTFFIFILVSYLRMFLVVRSPHLENDHQQQRNDSEVAKRMALLVFTDFFCWAPIAFAGLWSVLGDTDSLGITVKNSKFLLVIFFPINALCNPFLYAVSTNSFKRDFYDLLIKCGLCQNRIARINEGMYTNSMSHKQSQRNSETMNTVINSFGRHTSSLFKGSSEKGGGLGLLSKVLAKRGKLDKESSRSGPIPLEMSSPGTPMIDDVFVTPTTYYTSNENPFFPTLIVAKSDLYEEKEVSEENSLLRSNRIEEDEEEEEEEDKEKEDSVLRTIHSEQFFSQYDLTPEALRKAETTCL